MIGEKTEKQKDAMKSEMERTESICLMAEGGLKTPHGHNTT